MVTQGRMVLKMGDPKDTDNIPVTIGDYMEFYPPEDGISIGVVSSAWLKNSGAAVITLEHKNIIRYTSWMRHLTTDEILIYNLEK